jgi:hypothetical protein
LFGDVVYLEENFEKVAGANRTIDPNNPVLVLQEAAPGSDGPHRSSVLLVNLVRIQRHASDILRQRDALPEARLR